MTAAGSIVISGALVAGVLSALWTANDDRFGHPAEFRRHDTSDEEFTIPPPSRIDTLKAKFKICAGPILANCVVDGDTFWFDGDKIRVADIDAPEVSSPLCEDEKQVGKVARDRLLALLNDGGFSLRSGWRDADRYGRKLRTVTRDGRSLGEMLVEGGLARRWNDRQRNWCARD